MINDYDQKLIGSLVHNKTKKQLSVTEIVVKSTQLGVRIMRSLQRAVNQMLVKSLNIMCIG